MVIHRGKRAAPLPPTNKPLCACIMTIDSAKRSGVATYVKGKLWHYHQVDARDPQARIQTITDGITTAYVRNLPYALVVEVPWGGFQNAALSLHATATLWADTWKQLGQPKTRLLERTASDWRRSMWGKCERDVARKLEAALALSVVKRDMRVQPRPIGPDAAAAICIGHVMLCSRELQQQLGCALVA